VQPGGAVRGNANIPGLQQWVMEVPPVTRAWIIASVITSLAVVSLTASSMSAAAQIAKRCRPCIAMPLGRPSTALLFL